MAKMGAGSSPRSVLGSWEMDARGEVTVPERRNCAKNKGLLENKGLSPEFFGRKSLSENNVFSEELGFIGNEGFSDKKGFYGLSEDNGFFKNQCFSEGKCFTERKGFQVNDEYTEIKGFSVSKVFPGNEGFSGNECYSENNRLSEIRGLFENKGISDNKGFFGNNGFFGKEVFSGKEGLFGSKYFSESGFDFWATQDEHEVEKNCCRRNVGIFIENRVKEDRVRVSEEEVFSESCVAFGVTEGEYEVKRNSCRRSMGFSRDKCLKEERVRFSRVFPLSLGECEGGFRRKRRRKKEKENERENNSDPLVVLGSDIMLMILYRLDARSLAQSILVSHGWQALAACDHLWSKKCEQLWFGKAHLPRAAMQRGLSKLAAYSISVLDAKRTRIMNEDLCNHVWEFRFKTPAPLYWLNLDPSWRGTGPPMRRYFHPDGSQTADPTDRVWGGHECTYSIVVFPDHGKIREHYVRINKWPRMSVSRKHDWGWELDNHVYCYSSIPDADKEGGTGPLHPIW
ncbi:hypothetical protein KI387_035352 [Taxus chinensis]|uniref:F-box domain-containing protein n=1 Tax=Taxus chinensis TaxID=29808 RepID=A0AA38FNG5_TAXCH|nr:hypothetical protein KI387_035352 [Taxus chinensis]